MRIVFILLISLPFYCISQLSLVYPANGSVKLSNQLTNFTWNSCDSCTSYALQFSLNSNFDSFSNQEIFNTSFSIDTTDGTYFWRVHGLSSTNEVLESSNIRKIDFIDLENMGDLQFWLEPTHGMTLGPSNEVISWVSNSSNLYELNQENINQSPIVMPNLIGQYSGVYFDGINNNTSGDYLSGGPLSLGSIFTVFRHNNNVPTIHSGLTTANANPRFAIILGPPDGQYLHTYSSAFQNFKVNGIETNQAPSGSWLLVSSTRNSSQNMSSYTISSLHSGYKRLNGSIMENIAYSDPLSEDDQVLIENYLRYKYAPPVNLGQDRDVLYGFCETSISPTSNYENYLWSDGSSNDSLIVTESGEYWVECTDLFGYVSRDTIIVNYPNYTPPENTIYCPNEVVVWNPINQSGYSFIWSDGSTEQENLIGTSGNYSVTIQDSLGCSMTSNTYMFSEDNFPSSVSLGPDTSLCSGNSIAFISGYNEADTFFWSDGSTLQNLSIQESGFYAIEASNSNGCIGQDTIQVTIIGTAPALSYSIENEVCQGSPLNFSENSTVPPGNTIEQVVWNFGQVDSVFTSSGSQIYLDSGLYSAFLEVSTLEGCSSKEIFQIRVHPKPIISFATENYCPYEEIEFSASNEYDVPLLFYNWEFGQNGNTSSNSNPLYSYDFSGYYDVQLIATDTNNCVDTVIQNVFIQPAPVAEISISDPCELAPLQIIDNSSIEDTFSIITYAWNYGDNTSAINPNEDKIYESYGQYNVQLALEADNGCVDTVEQLITVYPKPVLAYDVGPACKNTWTSLENISTIPEGSLTETNWLINLQYNLNQQNTAFKFPTLGIQLVNLESISDQGCISDTTFEIDVQNEISADYTVNPMNLTSGTPIQFINESVGADSSFWDFGDGNGFQYNQNQINEITYDQTLNGSSVNVGLIVSNNIGCRDTSGYTYEIKEAYLDLALQTLFVQDINGYLTVGVELSNLGSVMIENADLYLKSAENGSILENWTGQLAQSESEIYIFNAHPPSYSSTQDDTERYICIEGSVSNSGYLDVDVSNNIICKNIEGNGLVVLPIYPNPTEDDITVSILLTESSPLHIELVDQSGRLIIIQDYTENLNPGIHKVVLPFSNLQKGIYHLRVSDSSTTLLEKIVRN